jgi:hypothetical protein
LHVTTYIILKYIFMFYLFTMRDVDFFSPTLAAKKNISHKEESSTFEKPIHRTGRNINMRSLQC